MPVDVSLYQNLLRPPKSIAEYQAEADQREQNQLALQGQRMNLLSAQRAQQDEDALRALYQRPDFNPQSDAGISELMRISPKAGAAAYQAQLTAKKTQAETEHLGAQTAKENATSQKEAIAAAGTRLKQYRDTLDFVDTPQGAARWLKAQFDDPLTAGQMGSLGSFEQAVTRIPQDPAGFQQWRQAAAMGMEKHLAQLQAAANAAETARHNRTAEGLTARGQNMADARAREFTATTMTKPFEVTGPDGTSMLVQQDRQGNIMPVQGYAPKAKPGGDKPLPNQVQKQLTEARDQAATISRLADGFKDAYGSKGVLGFGADASMSAKGVLGADKDAVEWWKNYRKQAELVERHALFGAALTPGEQQSWQSADISPGMNPKVIKRNLETRRALAQKIFENTTQDLIDAGHSEKRIQAIAGRNTEIQALKPSADGWSVEEVR